ncbi:MAG: 3-deoxy-manno-octulosonate cytidylyltransferase [Candidatus Omnitrophica bacterium]|jgi:3-deoxy-manno-octulosonate cytidylyltransferase (CMP-KDO synthetase)|nr:3-deoxy-manno-octulosonate cytidylyltransferase [Candidatus Omnitrophota bacterium]
MQASFKVVGVIPARYESTRLKHKLLRSLYGKTLLQRTWESACGARLLDKLIIACDHPELEDAARKFKAEVLLTSRDHISGTDRVAEAIRNIDTKIVINIQADEPLIHPTAIDSLAQEMLANSNLNMATLRKAIAEKEEINNPNIVKVICDKDNFAIYFSRLPIPYCREEKMTGVYYKHLGIYAYTKDFIYTFKNLPSSRLEKAEKLEQLRVIEAGYKIKVIETQFDSLGVDTEEDLHNLEKILGNKNLT